MPSDRKFWNKIARKYAKDPIADMAAYEYTLERTASYLSPHQRVLEIGCGTGTTALRLAPHVAQYTGTDVSDEMIAIAREKNAAEAVAHLSFEQFDVDTDHTTQTYDVILGFNVLHLLRGSDYGISTLDQMLQPGGLLITKTICYPDGWRGIALRSIIAVMPLLRMIGKAPFCAHSDHTRTACRLCRVGIRGVGTGKLSRIPAAPVHCGAQTRLTRPRLTR